MEYLGLYIYPTKPSAGSPISLDYPFNKGISQFPKPSPTLYYTVLGSVADPDNFCPFPDRILVIVLNR
jgi:hypothetical protein